MPPPSAYSAPQYYTPEQQAFSNQVPGMYNISNGGTMPMNNGPPPGVAPPNPAPMPIIPTVRKLEETDVPAEKKPRLEEPEWQAPQIVSTHIIYNKLFLLIFFFVMLVL